MSTISKLIFKGGEHYLSSPFGPRKSFKTGAGSTSSFHSGADYATYGKKIAQYAIAEGTILSCGKDGANAYALFVWVSYPGLGVKMLHYHLDRIKVKAGQKVKKGTLIGYTGMTGRATGIHLHLGIKRLSGGGYIDPEAWSRDEYPKLIKKASAPKYEKGKYKVTADILKVRSGAGTIYPAKKFKKFSDSAKKQIKALNNGKEVDGYVKGLFFTCSEIKANGKHTWGKTPSGWVALEYCKKV